MKHTFRYIISSLLLLVPVLAHAQEGEQVPDPELYKNYKVDNGVANQKTLDGPTNGRYTLTLETFATGETTVINVTSPADIVLVLDLSQSMTGVYGDNYVARNGNYSYNSLRTSSGYGSSDKAYYFYRHTDGKYYQVQTTGGNNQRRLRYQVNGTWWYLWGSGSQTGNPSGTRNDTATIFTGDLYECTRLTALQAAVEHFVEVIHHNALYEDDTDTKPRDEILTNRISVVTFGGGQGNTTVTRQMSGLTLVYNDDENHTINKSMISGLLALTGDGINNSDHYGTYSDEGMALANTVLNGIPAARKASSTRTVVLFTDGEPGSGPGWQTGNITNNGTNSLSVADRCIRAAATAKTTHTASVFTIALADISRTEMANYLQYTSSNHPDATNYNNPGEKKFDTYALEAGEDLTGIFDTVAQASGGSAATIPAGTQVRDEVSSSFEIPSNFTADKVKVYTLDALSDGTGFDEDSRDDLDIVILPSTYDLTAAPDKTASYMTDEHTVGLYMHGGKIMVIGFNYSKEDTEGVTPYDGNWVGWRGDGVDCAGKELVIEFEIEAQDGVTGGDGTNTNTASSGVYVPVYNEDGSFAGYSSVNSYPYPQTDLPINIVIVKKGLRRGESATIQIYYAPVDKSNYDLNTGKPVPNLTNGWKNFSKVILTNTTDQDGADVTKTLLCLDPEYVYRLKEDDWGWGYILSEEDTNTSATDKNPFVFENRLDTGAPKHAEAVSINIFGEGGGSKSYKASKVLSYGQQQGEGEEEEGE